ncbi:ABC transporter-related protein [Pyrolobus fumarii 1A]|uniref:ABC transporter-related protein n=1 Tax=Pyrolobus fumarii (strain DSM 11204 / 1A) TaxID=694429 RepID=G0EEQ9_PYRF1|nr:ABC transporter ATP-binding protein [Pyrolobus fumarii]AEM38881.1 ABC transporter-related protein [Pyrolobus fumarii 1A]
MFAARSVWKVFGSTLALVDVNVSFEGSGLHFLLGPNGSGKSTLLRLFAGILRPSRGSVSVFGLDPWRSRDTVCRRVCFVFEDVGLPWWLSGREFLRFVISASGSSWERMVEVAELLDIASFWDRPIRSYSTGMRKRLLLAAGMGRECEAYVFDEPFSGLDVNSISVVLRMFEWLARGHPVVVTTHVSLQVPADLTRSIVVLVDGKVVYSTSSDSDITRACFACSPEILDEVYEAVKDSARFTVRVEDSEAIICTDGADLSRFGCKNILDPLMVYEAVLRSFARGKVSSVDGVPRTDSG